MESLNVSVEDDPEQGLRQDISQAPSAPQRAEVVNSDIQVPRDLEPKVRTSFRASAGQVQAADLPSALEEGRGASVRLPEAEAQPPAEAPLAPRKVKRKKVAICKKCASSMPEAASQDNMGSDTWEANNSSQESQKRSDDREDENEKGTEPHEKCKQGQDKDKRHTEEKVSSLKHGKFLTDGRIQEFVYIPTSEVNDIGAKSSELFDTILRHWNLQRPQLLIKFQSGLPHPKNLLNQDEIDKLKKERNQGAQAPEMWKYFEHFKHYICNKHHEEIDRSKEEPDLWEANDDNPHPDSEGRERWTEKKVEREALKYLNEFLYKSISNLIDVIVRAAVRNRCWILVEGGPSGGLVLLKQAADRCTEKPKILVIDALRRKRFAYPQVEEMVKEDPPDKKVKTLEDLVKLQISRETADQNLYKSVMDEMKERLTEKNYTKFEEKREEKRKKAKSPGGKRLSIGSRKSNLTVKSSTSSLTPEEEAWERKDQRKVEEIRMESAVLSARLLHHAQPIDKPIRDPLKLGLKFWQGGKPEKDGWDAQTSEELRSGRVPWNQWHFRGGTHYIFTDDENADLLTDCLAPSGCIFIGGGKGSKKELIKMLIQGEPIVCLDNTGRLTQDFVRCHKYFCSSLFKDLEKEEIKNKQLAKDKKAKRRFQKERSKQTDELDKLDTMDIPSMSDFLAHEENTDFMRNNIARRTMFQALASDGAHGALQRNQMVSELRGDLSQVDSFTQPELCELFLTYLRRGLQITKLCVVMDPLNPRECSGGHTEDKLSMCLSNFVILASNDTSDFADVEAVKAASDLKEQLTGAARAEGWWAVLMTYMLLGLNFLSLIVALAQNSAAPEFLRWLPEGVLDWGLPAVSAASTFISGLVARFRFMLRWSKARSASAQLDAEIWKFRTRVDDYVVVGARDVTEDEEGTARSNELGQAFTRERKQDVTRTLFRANVTNIFNTAMEEMGTSSLHGGGFDELPKNQRRRKLPFLCWCCGMRQKRRMPSELPLVGEKGAQGSQGLTQQDWKNFGHLGVDEYYQQRTLDMFERMKSQAFWLTFMQGALESSVLLLGTFGVLLSTFRQTELAMICLSLAASLQALERFHALSNRLDAANAGERDLICAWQEWSAMEPMQRRFQSNVNRLVLTTEGVGVALTSAATAGVRQTLTTTKAN